MEEKGGCGREGKGVECFVLWSYKPHSRTMYQQFGHQYKNVARGVNW